MRDMEKTPRPLLAMIAFAPLAAGLVPIVAAADNFRWQGRLTAGQAIEVKGVNGRIEARAGGADSVEVTAVKHGRRNSPDSVDVRVVEHGGGVTICAVYPTPPCERANECAPGTAGPRGLRAAP